MADDLKNRLSKKTLVGASGTIIGVSTLLFSYIDSKADAIDKRIDEKYRTTREYVDERHAAVQNKLETIEKLLIKIDDRVYEIKKNQKGN